MSGSRLLAAAATAVALAAPLTVAVAAPAAAAVPTFTWTGLDAALGNPLWSDGANWAGGVAPPAGTPIDIAMAAPCPSGDCYRSAVDVTGILVNDITVTGDAVLNLSVSTGSLALAGDITVTGATFRLDGATLTGATSDWTVDGGELDVRAEGGTHVAVTLANEARFRNEVLATSLSITGADAGAAPDANGTVEFLNGRSPTLLTDVAVASTQSSQTGPLLTDGALLRFGFAIGLGGFVEKDLVVNGSVVLDPGTTLVEATAAFDFGPPIFPPRSETDASHIAATGTFDLGSATLVLDLGGSCIAVGRAAIVASSAPNGLIGTFAGRPEGAIITAVNPGSTCGSPYFQLHYDRAAGTATATVVAPPGLTVATSHTPTVPGLAVTFTARVTPVPPGGTVSFSDNGTPVTGCAARPVSTTTGEATCTTSYAAAGAHTVNASFSGAPGFPPAGPSPSITQLVVPAPTSTITTPSGLATRGEVLEGDADDTGGPGLYGVVLYYQSLTGGPSGAVLATCDDCGAGHTSSHWSFTTPLDGVPGIYAFVVQAYDVAFNPGPASNVIYQIIT